MNSVHNNELYDFILIRIVLILVQNMFLVHRGVYMKKRTRDEAKNWFREMNVTQSEWGRRNGYSSNEISRVLTGKSKCLYGREREIAIKLNIALES